MDLWRRYTKEIANDDTRRRLRSDSISWVGLQKADDVKLHDTHCEIEKAIVDKLLHLIMRK